MKANPIEILASVIADRRKFRKRFRAAILKRSSIVYVKGYHEPELHRIHKLEWADPDFRSDLKDVFRRRERHGSEGYFA